MPLTPPSSSTTAPLAAADSLDGSSPDHCGDGDDEEAQRWRQQQRRRRRQSPFASTLSHASDSPSPGSSSGGSSCSPPLTRFFHRRRALSFAPSTACKSRRTECPLPPPRPSGLAPKAPAPKNKQSLVQTFIDAGQANPYHSTCKVCGMLFSPGHAADDAVHRTFCAQYRTGPRIKLSGGWEASAAPQPQSTIGDSVYRVHRCHSHDPAKIRGKVHTAVTFVKGTLRANAEQVETLVTQTGKRAWLALLAVDSHDRLHGFVFISDSKTLKEVQGRTGDGDAESGNEGESEDVPEVDWLWVLPALANGKTRIMIADMMMASVGLKAADTVMVESNLDLFESAG